MSIYSVEERRQELADAAVAIANAVAARPANFYDVDEDFTVEVNPQPRRDSIPAINP